MLSYDRLSRKPTLFKSFTGLTVREFDDIYDNEISKRYRRHEIRRLPKERIVGNDPWVLGDISSWMLKTGF